MIASRPYPRSAIAISTSHHHQGDEPDNSNMNLESASYSYSGSMETSSERKGDAVRRRRRRQRRLVDDGEVVSVSVHRASPSTIPEHQSIHHAQFENDKLSLSAAYTSETALMSTMTPETPEWAARVASAPTTGSTMSQSERSETIISPHELYQPTREGIQSGEVQLPRNSIRMPSPTTATSSSSSKFSGSSRRIKMSKSKELSSKPKPMLRKTSTAPASCVEPKQTDVLDNVLMDRAFFIRQRLINFEMQELAAEAEKAAESGLEKFVGSASKFGAVETPPYRPKFVDDAEFVMSSMRANEGFITPLRPRNPFVNTLTHPMDYTPSYFSRKKIPVTKLRHVSEIIPNFEDMHNNIRIHLGREGVDTNLLPIVHTRRTLVKSDTDDTEREDMDDAVSQVYSVAASHTGSISSFSSYAVASLTSLRDLMTSSSVSNYGRENSIATDARVQNGSRTKKLHFSSDVAFDNKGDIKPSSEAPTHCKTSVAETTSDSDDSSVEFYGRKSPSMSTDASEVRQRHISLSKSGSGVNANQHTFQRTGSNTPGASVTFETQIAYEPTANEYHKNVPENASFDVDQRDGASPLSHLEIMPSSSSIRTNSKLTPMADFLHKIQNQFSLTSSVGHQPTPKVVDEDNEYFLTNFLYTCQNSDNVYQNGGLLHLNLEINPERNSEPFCLQGCGPNEMLSACDSATKYADIVFDWFNGGSSKSKKQSAIIDPDEEQSMNPNWLKTWQAGDAEEKNKLRRRIFTPPKLSAKNAVEHYESNTFCSPNETDFDCDDSLIGCAETRQPMTCPEIQNNIKWPHPSE